MMIKNVPPQLQSNILSAFGEKGQQWLESLPQQVAYYTKHWDLIQLRPMAPLTYHYVLMAHKKDYARPVVLKLGVPNSELTQQIAVLTHYQGKGAPLLLASDAGNGVLLMDCIAPGTTLKSYFPQYEAATVAIVAKIIQQLHQQKLYETTGFPSIQQWHRSLTIAKPSTILPDELLKEAQTLSEHLIATQANTVLLHGDLHHDNVLLGPNDTWFAIDPKGIIGEPAYEVGAFIRNPIPELLQQADIKAILQQRILGLASILKLDKNRIMQWGFVQAVLAACWSMEENDNVTADYFVRCAKVLKRC